MITVDCGIGNVQEIKYARHLGCDVILTDHHKEGTQLPPANAILHANDAIETKFSGAGIAFKFLRH